MPKQSPLLKPKFLSMPIDAPAAATHLLQNPDQWLTPMGLLLRKTSLDELPQLWSIFKGDVSFVPPTQPFLIKMIYLYRKK